MILTRGFSLSLLLNFKTKNMSEEETEEERRAREEQEAQEAEEMRERLEESGVNPDEIQPQ